MKQRPELIVVCTNDFPHCVLQEGTTEKEAEAFRRRLEEEQNKPHPGWAGEHMRRRIYVHLRTVPLRDPNGTVE